MIDYICPSCGHSLQILEKYANTAGRCKNCGATFKVDLGNSQSNQAQKALDFSDRFSSALLPLAVVLCVLISMAALVISSYALYETRSFRDAEFDSIAALPSKNVVVDDESEPTGEMTSYAKGTPEYVVARYLSAQRWEDRLDLVIKTTDIEKKMESYYGTSSLMDIVQAERSIFPAQEEVGGFVRVDVRLDQGASTSYFLTNRTGEYLIDWEAGTHVQSINWETLEILRPTEPITITAFCKFSTFYPSDCGSVKDSHLNIEMRLRNRPGVLRALVPRDSSAGQKILETLSSGQENALVLTAQYEKGSDCESLWITSILSDRLFIYDEEMRSRYTAIYKNHDGMAIAPFSTNLFSAKWIVSRSPLDGKTLLLPELKVKLIANEPISNLTLKIRFLVDGDGKKDILSEVTNYVASSSSIPLEKGNSTTVIIKGTTGYNASEQGAQVVSTLNASAELYFDVGKGYQLIETFPIRNEIEQ